MESKGSLTAVSKNWKTGKWQLTFELDSDVRDAVDKMEGKALRISAVQWREKRSLTANAYFHKLKSLIALELGVDDYEVHNEMIASYGQPMILFGELVTVEMRTDVNWKKVHDLHLQPQPSTQRVCEETGEIYQTYTVMRGSHTYNSKEMANLIEGVVHECKVLAIETIPPDELKRMLQRYEV